MQPREKRREETREENLNLQPRDGLANNKHCGIMYIYGWICWLRLSNVSREYYISKVVQMAAAPGLR